MLSVIKFAVVIITGWLLKKLKILRVSDIKILSPIMIYITLPCALASSTRYLEPQGSLLILALISFAAGAVMMAAGRFASRSREEQLLFMVNLSSLNIGGFAVPFIQGVLPSSAAAFAGIYDIGNAGYGNGASYLIPKALRDGEGKIKLGGIFKKLVRSVPLMTYLVFMALAFARIKLPDPFFEIIETIGNCNFLIVFLIAGIAMDLRIDRKGLGTVAKFLIIKYTAAILLSAAVYFLLPFDAVVKQAAIFCIFAPQASTSVAYCELLGCNPKVYSTMYTGGILVSLCSYTVLNMIWGL